MSAVIVLSPIIVASWPAVAAAVAGAAAAMGFAIQDRPVRPPPRRPTVAEAELEESAVIADELATGRPIILERDDLRIEVRQDERGRCRVCASSLSRSQRELQQVADDVAGRVVQQFVYHKLLTELKGRHATVLHQERLADDSVRVHVRL